jgi:replicative DNA helicase
MTNNSDKPQPDPVAALFGVEAERAVLGAFLLDGTESEHFYEATAAGLVVQWFSLQSNRAIYSAMVDLVDAEVPIDMVTLVNYLSSEQALERVGGVAYISSLVEGVPDRPSIRHYVDILKDLALRRAAVSLANTVIARAQEPSDSIRDCLADAHEAILLVQGEAQEKTLAPLAEITGTVLGNIEKMMSYDPYGTIGVPFGLAELDEATTGMRNGHLIILGGFPKSGKTSFAIDTVRKAAKGGMPIGVFSREMLKEELVERLLTQESDVPYAKIRRPMNLSVSEFRLLERTKSEMDVWPLYIDDEATSIAQMVPRAHLMIRKYKVRLLVFDYIQIIGAPGDKEYDRVSYVSSTLASLAKKTGVPVLALSQLTSPEGRKGDMNIFPNMRMLRSSANIAQDANLILFTYHPVDKQTDDPTGEDLVIVGAQRSGPTGRIKAYFAVGNQRWEPRGVATAAPVPKQETIFSTSAQEDF